jgi:hypothetical protein
MAEELLVTQGKAMRAMREQGIILTFPSGNNYRVRVPGAAGLLKRGNLPNILITYATEMWYEGDSDGKRYENFIAANDKSERALETIASFKVVCQEMFMDPRIVDDPQGDDEITIDDLSPQDQTWAFWLAFIDAKALGTFRSQQAPDVVGVVAPQDVSADAQQ